MSWVYRTFIRPALFAQDSEAIHNFTIHSLGRVSRQPLLCDALGSFFSSPELAVKLWGLEFPNPVGVAAGMDKDAEALPAWAALGFGFTELGAVTWHPQPGNPQPRVFRAIAEEALVNRMGFNNAGAVAIAERLTRWRAARRWPNHPVGVNLGKSKITPLADAAQDYACSFRALWPHLDFFVVNVSSPNTPNLRELQDKAALSEILAAMQEVNREMQSSVTAAQRARPNGKPILVKIAPDLTWEAIDQILELVEPYHLAGLVATNTTLNRPETGDARLRRVYSESGGLSGKPLRARSTEVVRFVHRRSAGKLPIVGVGGVFSAEDAWEKITAGASLIQLYTGLVYEGPGAAKAVVKGLVQKLEEAALDSLSQAVGLSDSSAV